MKVAPFRYHRPSTLSEALDLLEDLGDTAKVLAGGQSLLPMMAYRLVTPTDLVDIGRIVELRGWDLDDSGLRIHAMARQRQVELDPDIGLRFPVLHHALEKVAHVQIRNRGTVCGSLAHADSAAELPALMVALGSTFVVASAKRRRHLAAADFFKFHFTTAVEAGELLTDVIVPDPGPGHHASFMEVSRRRGDFAIVGAAVVVKMSEGRVRTARVVCSGVAPTPFLVTSAAEAVVGSDLGDAALLDAQYATSRSVDPPDDFHATGDYRRQLAGVLVRRCFMQIRGDQGANIA